MRFSSGVGAFSIWRAESAHQHWLFIAFSERQLSKVRFSIEDSYVFKCDLCSITTVVMLSIEKGDLYVGGHERKARLCARLILPSPNKPLSRI
jgi:hypothetical protein